MTTSARAGGRSATNVCQIATGTNRLASAARTSSKGRVGAFARAGAGDLYDPLMAARSPEEVDPRA